MKIAKYKLRGRQNRIYYKTPIIPSKLEDITNEYLFNENKKGNLNGDELLLLLFAKDLAEKSRDFVNLKKSLK
jgi:hypothetical protein